MLHLQIPSFNSLNSSQLQRRGDGCCYWGCVCVCVRERERERERCVCKELDRKKRGPSNFTGSKTNLLFRFSTNNKNFNDNERMYK